MKNIHLIPTDKPSRLKQNKITKKLSLVNKGIDLTAYTPINIYITSDEEIKEGDWYISILENEVYKATNETQNIMSVANLIGTTTYKNTHFKIILTTDQDLIKDGVQAIDDEFLEWFVKNPSCEEVEVEKILLGKVEGTTMLISKYKIILQKEEIVGYKLKSHIDRKMVDRILKDSMPIWNDEDKSVYFIRGHVAGSLVARMKELQVLDLWFTPIYEFEEVKSDWIKQNHLDYYYKEGIMSNKPKQETLEEAAEKYSEIYRCPATNENEYCRHDIISAINFGAKWQAKRMYSKEDVIAIVEKSRATGLTAEYLIEQFKNK